MEKITDEELKELLKSTSERNEEILSQKDKLNIGITTKDIQDLFNYVCGNAKKPLFIDRFTSDTNDRLKEMLIVMNQLQLSELPIMTAYKEKITNKLLEDNLDNMDCKELSSLLTTLNKEIQTILDTSTKAIQTINQYSPLNSEYRKLIDNMLLVPEEKLDEIERMLNRARD